MDALLGTEHQATGRGFDADLLQWITFRVADEEYAVDILNVQEIIKTLEITRVPKAPSFVEGVVNLRGKVVPIVNLRKRLHIPAAPHTQQTRIIVLDVEGNLIGLIADSVSEVMRLSPRNVESPPSLERKVHANYITGVGKIDGRLVVLLDLKKLLSVEGAP